MPAHPIVAARVPAPPIELLETLVARLGVGRSKAIRLAIDALADQVERETADRDTQKQAA